MSHTNFIKTKDENIDSMIKKILNIKDSNISFPKNAVSKERVKGRLSTVFTGKLTYKPSHCEHCGCPEVNRHSFKDSWIQLLPYQEVPTYLHLYKQRFYCKKCHLTFSAKTYYVAENCYLAQSLKFAIAIDLKKKISMKDIASRYFVSSKTIERVLDSFFKEPCHNLNYLPKHLLIDEFKGTTDCEGAMCFIISDADTGKIFDILDDRRNYKLERYFMRFSFKARRKVSHIVMDMNAAYGVVTKRVFPHARISVDRFHVVQQLTRALNKQRIKAMNQLKKSDSEAMKNYRKFKKYWRTLLKKNSKLNYFILKQYPLFQKRYLTESDVIDHLMTVDESFKSCYEIYQELLDYFDKRDYQSFFDCLTHLETSLPKDFKKALLYLQKHQKEIINAFIYPYSNGKLEGKNNLIKVIKRIAFGFRTFRHLRMRVLIQQNICQII